MATLNPYVSELLRQIGQQFDIDTDTTSVSQYLCANTKLNGKPFNFQKYPYQEEVLDDPSRSMCLIKPSQVGASEIFQRSALAFIRRNKYRKIIYAYPSDALRLSQSQTRFQPLIESNKVFEVPEGASWTRSISIVQMGTSFMYLTGSKATDMVSLGADSLIIDEVDLHDPANVALFSSRLQNSDLKIARYISTPTFSQVNIDSLYESSDQMSYMIACDACGHWQFPMFEPRFVHMPGFPSDWESLTELTASTISTFGINLHDSYVCCERCRARLDLGKKSNRQWVAKYPSRVASMRGRKINCFSVATRPIADIVSEMLVYKSNNFMRGFTNSVLGQAEDSSNNRIDEALILKAFRSAALPEISAEPCWLGCDMGHIAHLVILQGSPERGLRTILMEEVPIGALRERIVQVLATYNIVKGFVDRHPESALAHELADISGGKILPCEYRGTKELNLVMHPLDNERVSHVQVDRTMHLDQVPRILKSNKLEMYGYGAHQQLIITHLRNMVRVESPETPATWVKLNSADHFFHALGFALSATKMGAYLDLKIGATLTMFGFVTADMKGYDAGITSKGSTWQASERLY